MAIRYVYYFPVRTRRYFDIHATSFSRYGRCMDIETTSCAYGVITNLNILVTVIYSVKRERHVQALRQSTVKTDVNVKCPLHLVAHKDLVLSRSMICVFDPNIVDILSAELFQKKKIQSFIYNAYNFFFMRII